MSHPMPQFTIEQLDGPPDAARMMAIERIFFSAGGTQRFADEAARDRFRERWLGRYLDHPRDCALTFVAIDGTGHVAGYVIGSTDDPARTARFADIGYFAELADLTARYPAHLHINLIEGARGLGIGGRLVEAFCGAVAARSGDAVHVVTGANARNRAFYERLRFSALRTLTWNGNPIVMLGRRLA